MAPELNEAAQSADHRADIYSLGCTLYFLMTGRAPFLGATALERRTAHRDQPAPVLRHLRPDAPQAVEDAFQKMMAQQPADRPSSMTEVIALLESQAKTAVRSTKAPPGRPIGIQRPARPRQATWRAVLPAPVSTRVRNIAAGLIAALALAFVGVAIPWFAGFRTSSEVEPARTTPPGERTGTEVRPPGAAPVEADSQQKTPTLNYDSRTIFDGTGPKGWMLTSGRPLPRANVQPDGLNPHGTGSYLAVYEQKAGDFVLDFDYKLSRGCNSGVFLRVGDLKDPVNTGIEVALDDTTGTGRHDPGAFYDLVSPSVNAQKPAGAWNHMTILAASPVLAVALNGVDVSRINLDEWTTPGKRPDGSEHKFRGVALSKLARSGYFGFQDHGSDCWFKNVILKTRRTTDAR
jgi:hypothetical protein